MESDVHNFRSFESSLVSEATALALFFLPVLQCLIAAAALSGTSVLLGGTWLVGPLLAFVAAAGWCWVSIDRIKRNSPFATDATDLRAATQTIGTLIAPSLPKRIYAWFVAGFTCLILATPWWLACVAWSTVFMVLALYWRRSHRAVLIGGTFALLATIAVSLVASFGDALLLVNIVAVAILTITVFAVTAISLKQVPSRQRFAFVGVALLSVLTVPVAAVLGGLTGAWSALLLTLLVWPAMGLLVAVLYQQKVHEDIAEALERSGPRTSLGTESDRYPEDTVRESDGFYQIAYPPYRTFSPAFDPEAGYLTWLGDRTNLQLSGDAVVLRDSSFSPRSARFVRTDDAQGTQIAWMAKQVALGLKYDTLLPLKGALSSSWSARRARSRDQAMVKAPWDHPLVIMVPTSWTKAWIYPAGTGIHDRHAFPCVVRKADVSIDLRQEVLGAVDAVQLGVGSEDDSQIVRSLAANANRLLPAVYEVLLTELVRQFRTETSDIFFVGRGADDYEVGTAGARERGRVLAEVNAGLRSALPPEVARLITVTVLDLRIEALYADEVREVVERYRHASATQLQTKWRNSRFLRNVVRESVLGVGLQQGSDSQGQEIRDVLSQAVHAARSNIDASGRAAVNALGQMTRADRHANAFPEVQRALVEEHERFAQLVEDAFRGIDHALKSLANAARDTEDD